MAIRMLIDASHKEETRVAVVKGNRVEEFDYEAAARKQLKGNVYLAKVTRVEPSLQAAFVDYGGNRHGFLAFSEIHPDYYQIPVADREALIAEEVTAQAELDASDEAEIEEGAKGKQAADDGKDDDSDAIEAVDTGDVEDIHEELPRRPKNLKRRYKIQEVIKRRQVLLVQVVKEERGTKGAALTTYLSLAGRYCVLMPNTHHGGGVSRKIGNSSDRRKLKSILGSLSMPEGMGCIIRTAGLERTKAEIKRDFDYLMRAWDDIRELTLKSVAPALIYEEGDLIKRAIRDLYNKDIDEIQVEGEEGYKSAKAFMKLLMPSHTRKVQPYRDKIPLFHRYQVEGQLDSMFNPVVQLRSGGYIVINPTEALVAIDVNSGKATKEHNIEETALRTNMETAEEVARQLRLRDMAGLIVIDFIDMEDRGNIRQVERRLKDCLKSDRARIQVGRISAFGLLEMSRQRLRPGILEASTLPCPHCEGIGIVRSTESSALHVLRSIEEEGIRERSARIDIHVPTAVALYLLNEKRAELQGIEARYGFEVIVQVDDSLGAPHFKLERKGAPKGAGGEAATVTAESSAAAVEKAKETGGEAEKDERRETRDERSEAQDERREAQGDEAPKSKRRRRGRRGGRRRKAAQAGETKAAEQDVPSEGEKEQPEAPAPEDTGEGQAAVAAAPAAPQADEEKPAPKRRSRRKKAAPAAEETAAEEPTAEVAAAPEGELEGEPANEPAAEKPKRKRRPARAKRDDKSKAQAKGRKKDEPKEDGAEPPSAGDAAPAIEKPAPAPVEHVMSVPEGHDVRVIEVGEKAKEDTAEPDKDSKKGWWRRPLGA